MAAVAPYALPSADMYPAAFHLQGLRGAYVHALEAMPAFAMDEFRVGPAVRGYADA